MSEIFFLQLKIFEMRKYLLMLATYFSVWWGSGGSPPPPPALLAHLKILQPTGWVISNIIS